MFYKILTLIALILGTILYFQWRRKRNVQVAEPPAPVNWYQAIPALFTPAEQLFLSSLEVALQGVPVRIYGKTRIADLIRVRRGLSRSDYAGAFSKIRSKHVDFVLVHPLTFAPLLVIELDDSTHEEYERKVRDAFVDEAMNQAGIPILHVPLRKRYLEQNLRTQIVEILRHYHDYHLQDR